jgi:hypothetical protein
MRALLTLTILLFALPASAADNPFYPVQGVLSTATGDLVDGATSVTFSLYVNEADANAVWTESQSLDVDAGLFTAYLGESNDLDVDLFADNDGLWLGIEVASDGEMARVFIGSTPYAGYAARAGSIDASALPDDVVLGGQDCPAGTMAIGLTATGALLCDGSPSWDQACLTGSVVTGLDASGNLICDAVGDYDGGDFALSGTQCVAGWVMAGISATGLPTCEQPESYALTDQACLPGNAVTGVDAAGAILCGPASEVAADQQCSAGDVVTGLDAAGLVVCETPLDTSITSINGLSGGTIDGSTVVDGDLTITGALDVEGGLNISGSLTVGGETLGYLDDPLVQFGATSTFCVNSGTYTQWLNYDRAFDAPPAFIGSMDESLNNHGATWQRTVQSWNNRVGLRCNNYMDSLHWLAIDQGRWTIDQKTVEASTFYPPSGPVANGSAIYFGATFPQAPVVLAQIDETADDSGASNIRLINTVGVSGFEVHLYGGSADGVSYVAMEPGEYTYGRYHWLAGIFDVNNACSPSTSDCQFALPTGMFSNAVNGLFIVHDTNDSGGASYARARRLEPEMVSLYLPANTEFVHYVVWEEI